MTESDKVYCPSCGAMAAPDAEWCGLCYAPLAERRSKGVAPRWAATAGELPPAPPMPAVKTIGGTPVGRATVPAAPTNGHGEQKRPTWPCAVCGSDNDLDLDACAVCGASFGRLFEDRASGAEADPSGAVVRSLMFPGLGHIHVGLGAEGLARAILFLWSFGSGLLLLLSRGGTTAPAITPVGGMFLLASLALYALTAFDARRAALREPQVLSPRALLFGTVGMIVLSVGSLLLLVTQAAHRP